MKVNIPKFEINKTSIDLSEINLEENGLLLTKNPYGFIGYDNDDTYSFYMSSQISQVIGCEYALIDLIKKLKENYPNIEFEYFENE